MPNWCENIVTIVAPSEEEAKALETAYKEDRLFQSIIPFEVDGNPNWYFERVNAWGTKWETLSDHGHVERDGRTVKLWMDTAWAPPFGIYDELEQQGYSVEAYYAESGMCFCGSVIDGNVTEHRVHRVEDVPPDIDAVFEGSITRWFEDWDEDEDYAEVQP